MKINYPNPVTKSKADNKPTTYSRGMLFEHDLNESNKYYLLNDLAVIYKKPTPIRIVKVDYPSRSKARITEAYYQETSTTDYNGIYKGKYIDYEAKQTDSLSFSFEKISHHQVEHLLKIDKLEDLSYKGVLYGKLIARTIDFIIVALLVFLVVKKLGVSA